MAARDARAAAGLTRFEDEISIVSATTVGPGATQALPAGVVEEQGAQ